MGDKLWEFIGRLDAIMVRASIELTPESLEKFKLAVADIALGDDHDGEEDDEAAQP
jgi:hypothetical protein